jgi:hypothetical protein
MRKLLIAVIVGALAWKGYTSYVAVPEETSGESSVEGADEPAGILSSPAQSERRDFKCDGRVYCSQMTSCEEAMFFLKNCPGVKMDGSGPGQDGVGDGIPCESQWCGDR